MATLLSYKHDGLREAGCDEAGRGCLAGPVVAAAVILPKNYDCDELNDSKKLSEKKRFRLREIIQKDALAYAVSMIFESEIDELNILNASIKAMHQSLAQLKLIPEMILVDGNRFHAYQSIPHECIIKGDGKYLSIAAASILAKTYRDEFMEKLHHDFPQYNWLKNKGYPTDEHRAAIESTGSCIHHRKSFKLLPEKQLSLF